MYQLFIAIRHLTSRRLRTILSVLAIGLAVMGLMVSQALMVGFTDELFDKTVDKLPHVTIEPQEDEEYIYFYRHIEDNIRELDGVIGVSSVLAGTATFEYKDTTKNIAMQGIQVRNHDSVLQINEDIVEGSFRDLEVTKNSVVLGDKLADTLDVKLGDSIDASFPEANPMFLKVVGIYDSGTPADETLAFTSLTTAQDFFNEANVVNSIIVKVDDPHKARSIAREIEDMGLSASSWEETNPEILQTLTIETTSNNIVLGMILIIASFGIVSTLFMVVMEKTKEIGMLMAMGTSRRNIMLIFLLESGILGLLGAFVGISAGVLIATYAGDYSYDVGEAGGEFYAGITSIPFVVRIQDIIVIIVFTFLVNLIAGIYPARRAAKLDPVEAIRIE